MEHCDHAFGVYGESLQAEAAVGQLLKCGFVASMVTVLLEDNERSRDFARKMHTRPPRGTQHGKMADLPLDGSWGLQNPEVGPMEGALDGALDEMGVPPEWYHDRMRDGKVFLAVECVTPDDVTRAVEILARTGAEETSTWELTA